MEYQPTSSNSTSSTLSKAELRKTHKPIMEKRRRARINRCLNEIKTLILEALNKDPNRHAKLEKADILEMAVKHLQNVQRQQLSVAMATDPLVLRKFQSGFNECALEIDRYVRQVPDTNDLNPQLSDRIRSHLEMCLNQFSYSNYAIKVPLMVPSAAANSDPATAQSDPNNNSSKNSAIQLIATNRGELALVVPTSVNFNRYLTDPLNSSERTSAFVAVNRPKSPGHGFRPVVPRQHLLEPLCIITNQMERFKQAQIKLESKDLEENRTAGASSSTSGHVVVPPREPDTTNSDMWRPW